METKNKAEQITDKVLQSKKYRSLYRPTVKRIVEEIIGRFPANKAEKAAKRKLHQIWGAYFKRPNFDKLLVQAQFGLEAGQDIKEVISPILSLQSSTKERISILNEFYPKIFSLTGQPKSIIEPACGLNALTYFWMRQPVNYLGLDVDMEQISFINTLFRLTSVRSAQVKLGDLFVTKIGKADLVLLLKVLTILEHQKKGGALEVLRKMPSHHLVVSFPTRSLSGKPKGMVNYYSQYLENLIEKENWAVKKLLFVSELVFVIRK